VSLADFVEDTAEVRINDKASFTVYPLVLADLSSLLKDNHTILDGLMRGELDVGTVITTAPEFAASIIATAAREDGSKEAAARLPFGVQVDALNKIWGLTVYDPKEFMAIVTNLLSSMGVEAEPEEEQQKLPA